MRNVQKRNLYIVSMQGDLMRKHLSVRWHWDAANPEREPSDTVLDSSDAMNAVGMSRP